MRKSLKIILAVIATVMIIIMGSALLFFCITGGAKLDERKLIDVGKNITYYDSEGKQFSVEADSVEITGIEDLPENLLNAFISIEDKRFYSHHGIDYRGLARAFFNNVKSFSLKEGASTISQQLVKNTHLTNEKTFRRKLIEIKLARDLENKYTKKEILEKYLNTIYFGDNCYGITSASRHYFGKVPKELDLNECAALAGLVKAPSNYSPLVDYEKCNKRKNVVLKEMFDQGYITESEYKTNKNTDIKIASSDRECKYDYLYLLKRELDGLIDSKRISAEKLNVYTYCNTELQNFIESDVYDNNGFECDKSAVLINSEGHIKAYSSTCGEIYRSIGSCIKPLLVYAPAIETDTISSCSPILDEKTDFNGYSPSNYNDKYYGYISAKKALAKSLNVPAVKILNLTGIEKSLSYVKKTDIIITENDNSLPIALGATEKGALLTQLTGAYSVFSGEGFYTSPACIEKITDEKGNIIYKKTPKKVKIFNDDTIEIMNDILREAVTDGTAKKLSFNKFGICAKTGTVGNKKGNLDAYTVSYTNDYTLGIWCGNHDNSLMPNSITGGSLPCSLSSAIWNEIYKSSLPTEFVSSTNTQEVLIDKISYEKDHVIEIADINAPKKYVLPVILKKKGINLGRSDRFSNPRIENAELSVNNNGILIELCLAEYYDFKILRECNGIKKTIYDSEKNSKNTKITDSDTEPGKLYTYSVVPYYKSDKGKILGKEYVLKRIKSPITNIGDEWWEDDF